MSLSSRNLIDIINTFKDKYIRKRLNSIISYHKRMIVFSFQKEKDNLFINLDNSNPHLFLNENTLEISPISNSFINEIKRYILKGILLDIDVYKNQRILKFIFGNTDAFYHHHQYTLYLELIPSHANIILVDEDNKILASYFKDQKRVLFKGSLYHIDELTNINENLEFDLDKYLEKCKNELNKQKELHHKEKYGVIYRVAKRKEKTIRKKKESLTLEIEKDKERLKYIEYGKEILSRIYELKDGMSSFLSFDNETTINLDPHLSISKNAEKYFKEYKKSKKGIEIKKGLLSQIEDEVYRNQLFLLNFKSMDESELDKLNKNKNKNEDNIEDFKSYCPYYIIYNNHHIYFGKNIKQNDYLTFRLFSNNSKVMWFHIDGDSSSHVIINTDELNEELINVCSYVVLLASKKTSGHILYTLRKNVYRADNMGEANILEKKSKYIDSIPENYLSLIDDTKRHR